MGTGLARDESVWRNAILRTYWQEPIKRGLFIRRKLAKRVAEELVAAVQLSEKDINTPVRNLSGGHAQRLLTGREMRLAKSAVILTYPTRGLDIAAAAQLRRRILDGRARGLATLLISEDLDEILELSDRVLVLYEGEVVGAFKTSAASRKRIGSLMSGMRARGDKSALNGES
jgi:simple sugar transport system ATP-binding protein